MKVAVSFYTNHLCKGPKQKEIREPRLLYCALSSLLHFFNRLSWMRWEVQDVMVEVQKINSKRQ